VELAKVYGGEIPILGVCLGHQSIAQAFGGRVIRAQILMHGKTSMISHCETGLFAGLPSPFQATRYHSLVVERSSLPECFEITATAEDGEIMALRHQRYPVVGVQFHPESILTQHGHRLLDNFIDQV
jgi:anthranilate synthase/aminodeoxychorismate synthase-like glutamine amidotransferase